MKHSYKNFNEFFEKATGFKPYPYQEKLAQSNTESVLNIPTGAGKTETAILGLWLWKRLNENDTVPRRLVYCLPMRVLAEQTKTRVTEWLEKLNLNERISVEVLMGGSETKIQNLFPDKEYIIIGTQDMLISGALNRAYGNSQYVWPIIFGLLNNDCMWVMDEVQIMENALPTSIQLNYFRNKLNVYGSHKTIWMSATINPDWLETVDSPKNSLKIYDLQEKDVDENLRERNNAPKILHKCTVTLKKEYNAKDADELLKLHKPNTTTVIMINTVKRAQNLYQVLSKKQNNCKLIHSRFRGADRKKLNGWISKLDKNKDNIIVSTQVLEAGVDISARTMITELAPWANLVQRFGRCNRYNDVSDANVYWIDINKDNNYPPYDDDDLQNARNTLNKLAEKSISPSKLPPVKEAKFFDAILRHRDMINLFDTAPDLSGSHTDVSRFVRNAKKQLDVNVFWRNKTGNKKEEFKPERDELCSVSVFDLKNFLKKKKAYGYIWDNVDGLWNKVYRDEIFPGQIVMLDSDLGGYSEEYGWYDKIDAVVSVLEKTLQEIPESHDTDWRSQSQIPVTLEDHTKHVLSETDHFLERILHLDSDTKHIIRTSAKYHDVGKAHKIFQEAMKKGIPDDLKNKNIIWAKSKKSPKYSVLGFRHEVASALAYLKQKDTLDEESRNLVAYLIMSHHGKVRLSLRSISKKNSVKLNREYLLGIKIDGDKLPKFSSDVVSIEETDIDMSLANIGQDRSGNLSWITRTILLRDSYGPFRLAYLESLIRRADWHASAKETSGEYSHE